MRVFVDESGDTGFKFGMQSSRYFALALVIFEDEEKEAEASRRIDALRQELKSSNIEFHFAKNKDATHKAFFAAARDMNFRAFVFVADKTRLSQYEFKDRDTFYKSICGTAFEQAKYLLQEANVVFDDSGGEKFKRARFLPEKKRQQNQCEAYQECRDWKISRHVANKQFDPACRHSLRGDIPLASGRR